MREGILKQNNIYYFLAIIFIVYTKYVHSHPFYQSTIKNLRARYDANEDAIYTEWEVLGNERNSFIIRYRYLSRGTNNVNQWKYIRSNEKSTKLIDNEFRNGDEIEVQVKIESGHNNQHDWSKPLIIQITSKNPYHLSHNDENDIELMPPTNLKSTIVSPSSLKIEWDPVVVQGKKIYYIVILQQQSPESRDNYQRQQIKIEATNFAVEHLTPGESYEVTIRTAISSQQTSTMAAVLEVVMPRENEFFEIENIIISSKFLKSGQGIVNITWEIPEQMNGKVSAYDVQYAPVADSSDSKVSIFRGDRSEIILNDLKSNTEYKIRIKTILKNNIIIESGEFLFATPKVEHDTMKRVDIIFSNNMDTIRLQWILSDSIQKENVEVYQIYYSKEKDLSIDKWNVINVPRYEENIKIDNLHENTVYYVRIRIITRDRRVLDSPTTYRFRTSENYSIKSELRSSNSLSYRNVGPGAIIIHWNFDDKIKNEITGTSIIYTKNKNLNKDKWNRKVSTNPEQTEIILDNLEQGVKYYIEIIPHLKINLDNREYIQTLEIQTDVLDSNTNWEFPYFNKTRRTKRLTIESME
uniref:Fibronectin type-III domain-containing protein n=1 Tax=Parastrongyloides trichosuri TaxID=131310 RepID=A0A0N4ZAZ9_PARTI